MDYNPIKHPRKKTLQLVGLACCAASVIAQDSGPSVTVPEGGQAPGPYPNFSVTSANWDANGGNANDGNLELNLDENGPIPWAATRFNRGDIAVRLSPRDPAAAKGNLGTRFVQVDNATAAEAPGQVWTPNRNHGVLIPTARQNGPVTWPDGEGGFFPTVAVSHSSSGNGYDMDTGSFDTGEMEINTGKAGGGEEGTFDFATAWFPYHQGWLGGDVGNPDFDGVSSWGTPNSHAGGLSAGMVKWLDVPEGSFLFGGHARLVLPGVNSLEDGMIFATSSDGSSAVNIVGVAPQDDGSGWLVTIREDSEIDPEIPAAMDQSEFAYVYVPYNSANLVGGRIDGETGSKLHGEGDFSVSRTGEGTYELTIPGKTGADGSLLLQVADMEAGTSMPLASKAFLSYQFVDGKFVIQSRKTTGDSTADLADASFYVAWVDFSNPVTPPEGPKFRTAGPVASSTPDMMLTEESSIAASSHEPEILVTYIDSINGNQFMDPITDQFPLSVMVGRFHNANTLEATSEPFAIFGNPNGALVKNDVEYNPVTKQYVVVSLARAYNANGMDTVLVALINPASVAGENSPVAKAFAHDETTDQSYDDVSVAVSTANGNFLIGAERKFEGEGEGTVGVLYDKDANRLTAPYTRLDLLQSIGDEDDPEVIYLPGLDMFLYIANTDNSNGSTGTLGNRVVGSLVDAAPNTQGNLVVRTEQPLGNGQPEGQAEGHPSAVLNPFNGQLITVYDAGNGTSTGDIAYTEIGAAPGFTFTPAGSEVPYLAGPAGDPFQHQHPQLAVDENSGVIALGFNARGSTVGLPDGYAFILLGQDGKPLPSQLGAPYYLADAPGAIDHGVNYHTIKYSPVSDSFVVAYTTDPGVTYLAGLKVANSGEVGVEIPELSIAIEDGQTVLTWPSSVTGFVLESTESLSAPNWTEVTTAPESAGDLLRMEVTPGTMQFYRLTSE